MRAALIVCVFVAVLCACAAPQARDAPAKSATRPPDLHTSQNSLDWAGVYEGVLPCADCPGIKTRLTLNKDGTFELRTEYLDRPVMPQVVRGQFTWQASGNAISLDENVGRQQYAVGEGRLSVLDRDGKPISSPNRFLKLVPRASPK
jgi:uncharacterized lipoprotein NlpE involved in copper resistance